MSPARLVFGNAPGEHDPRLPRFAPWTIPFTLLPWLLALTQMGELAALNPMASLHAALSAGLLAGALFISACATILLMRARADGLVLMGGGVMYLCPILVTLAIALGPMASGGMALATLAIAFWSSIRIGQSFARIDKADVAGLSNDIIVPSPDGTGAVLLASTQHEESEDLRQLLQVSGPGWLLPLDVLLPVLALIFCSGTLQLGDAATSGDFAGAFGWLLWTELFLLARPVAMMALLRRYALNYYARGQTRLR